MRKLLLIAAACAGIASAHAQAIYYQDSKNCDMLRHIAQQDRHGKMHQIPLLCHGISIGHKVSLKNLPEKQLSLEKTELQITV